jgi:transcriptional regulator with GAF, ATPase, and Fis domain
LPPGPLAEMLGQRGILIFPGRATQARTEAQDQLRLLGGEVARGLAQDGRLLAFLVLGPKSNGAYRPEDLNLLAAFAQITVLALVSAEGHKTIEVLNGDLQGKVEKIAEQQRRIFALQSQLRRQGLLRLPGRGQNTPVPAASMTAMNGDPPLDEVDREAPFFGKIVGGSQKLRQLLQMVRKVGRTDAVVLIRGESGTGKELLAEAVHECSARAGKAFVKVHCAALSPTLLESELFGHVKGAFTGAHRDKVGRFELAHGGTLFLDEIGDISLDVQTKLLRVLQEKTFERVGSSEPVKSDVRIIAATHQNLEELIRQGRFREDLYYRLNVFPLVVPPLRQRREDVAELALHFLQVAAKRCGKPALTIEDDALALLKSHPWPGNIRQLENVLERAVVLVEGDTIRVRDLPEDLRREAEADADQFQPGAWPDGAFAEDMLPGDNPFDRGERDRLERDQLLRALSAAAGNKAQAARNLGIARSTLVSKLKKLGIQ